MNKYLKVIRKENGFTLVEVLMAIAIVAITGAALIGMMFTSSKILNVANADETARDYAQAQMEDIQNQPYDAANITPVYTVLPSSLPEGYTVELTTARVPAGTSPDSGLQKIIVAIEQGSETLFTLEGYKVNN